MPFHYQSSATPVRTRRPRDRERDKERDRESRNPNSSSSARKPKDIARSSTRTPPQSLRPAQPFLYAQQNLTLDQLPALPGSGTASPSSSSPVLRVSSSLHESALPVISSTHVYAPHLHTPAALQPYLDHEDDEPSFITAPEARTSPKENESPIVKPKSPEDKGPPVVQSTSPKEKEPSSEQPIPAKGKETPILQAATPKLINQPLESLAVISHSTLSPKSVETAVYRSSSPSPLSPAPSYFWSQPPPGPSIFDPVQPYPQNLTYVNSPPQFAPAVPYFPGPPSELYYPPSYGVSPYLAMAPPTGNPVDHQTLPPQGAPYYANYASPPQVQAPLHSLHRSSTRGRSSTSSGRSFSGDTLSNIPPSVGNPPEQALLTEGAALGGQEQDDDAGGLLKRIECAIPDLHLLLNRYQETHGQLEDRKSLIRETEVQKAAALKQKETDLESLRKEMDTASNKHTNEMSKLKLEIGKMEEKQRELQDSLIAEKKAKDELEAVNRALTQEKENMERKLTEEKNTMARDIKAWKENEARISAMKQNGLELELQRQRQESEANLQAQIAELNQRYALEREELQAGWERQRRELEDSHKRVRRDMETALEARQKAAEEAHHKQLQDREAWNKEQEALSRTWGEERAVLGKGSEEQRTILAAQHQRERDELQKKWQASHSQATKVAEEKHLKLQKEIEKLRAAWDADQMKFAKQKEELRAAARKLNDDNSKLQKLAEAFGDVTDLKSREDPFYDGAFHYLYIQISHLIVEHFRDNVEPPSDVAQTIPSTIPPFFSGTDSSTKLRAAYVEHLISTIISRRIFQPFLFTLSRRRGSPDLLFQSMSDQLRKKSTRREALWRQRTLHAAYTVSSAKQSINKIAASIVDEIVEAIKHFANPTHWKQVTLAVQNIVKTAAETWRYARLEVAMITASMPEESQPTFQKLSNPNLPLPNTSIAPQQDRQLLLPLFPIIKREAIHEDIREDSKQNDQGYIYFPGRMLYSDDPIIVSRLKELRASNVRVGNQVDEEIGRKSSAAGNNDGGCQCAASNGPLHSMRLRSDSQLARPPCSTPADDSNAIVEADRRATSPTQTMLRRDGKIMELGGSRGQALTCSSSLERSASSDARSSSNITRPATMPHWGGLGGIVPGIPDS